MFHVNLLELLDDWKQLSKHFHQMILYRNGCSGLIRTELDSNPGIHREICNQPGYQVPGALIGIRLQYFPVSSMYLMWCSMFMFGGVWDKFKKTYIHQMIMKLMTILYQSCQNKNVDEHIFPASLIQLFITNKNLLRTIHFSIRFL